MKTLLGELIKLRVNGPTNREVGICGNVACYLAELNGLFTKWPKYSGDPNFPILGGYAVYHREPDLWDKETEYGRLRWELLDFLIEQLSPETEKETKVKPFGEMTPEEKGLLLLAHHEGKTIEHLSSSDGLWKTLNRPRWRNAQPYRVKPEPEVLKKKLFCRFDGSRISGGPTLLSGDTLTITLTIVDGEIQPTTTVEKI